jgi:hypothetical protein
MTFSGDTPHGRPDHRKFQDVRVIVSKAGLDSLKKVQNESSSCGEIIYCFSASNLSSDVQV